MGRNLKMPWSMEDTIENMEHIRDIMIKKVRTINLDGKAEEDVKEVNFDFGRVKKALEKQIPMKVNQRHILRGFNNYPYSIRGDCPVCGSKNLMATDTDYCNCCGQKIRLELT
ncbi:hypothetical protein GKG47_11715 [Lactonifactor sp. BIOML-A3]|uniref:hypothetical protein n=1 Tax=unclassified Lactonifactor TaxID=2636670 RepID=UPI0012AF5CE4|nr:MULTISPECIES: hypothetical protein [unclassified Lactonifactor]MSA01069.1 hypothetical protein [Lactonifactor sp. BIOML-A5]MSA09868.1 hypothetical protein [Lactonifactor sp. BIOML-A4]MSA13096.1 hypothetical protein [Lactonifactor sp. BIOML-A3]MSA18632.1 hypothetical protein [Lactonifactor sp. BIOML-A2]MSA38335.1 hypothetical protein [Lactonifactor sp. BIOML-A1]